MFYHTFIQTNFILCDFIKNIYFSNEDFYFAIYKYSLSTLLVSSHVFDYQAPEIKSYLDLNISQKFLF